jgi:hypothetical protein
MIAVSKLCCPVCWELIKLLRTKATSSKLAIRGSHPHIYPLILPPWVSDVIRREMELKFLGYLGAELIQLIHYEERAEASKSHRRQHSDCSTFSHESSITLCSASSNSEGEFEDGEDYYPTTASTTTIKSELTSFLTDVFADWKEAAVRLGSRLGRE